MSWENPVRLTPRPPGTFRGRCDCLFWIVVEQQLNKLRCRSCGAPVRRAKREDFDICGVIDAVERREEASARTRTRSR